MSGSAAEAASVSATSALANERILIVMAPPLFRACAEHVALLDRRCRVFIRRPNRNCRRTLSVVPCSMCSRFEMTRADPSFKLRLYFNDSVMASTAQSSTLRNNARPYSAFALMCLAWGSTFIAIKEGVTSVPPFFYAGIRFVLAGILLFVWIGLTPRRFGIPAVDMRR